MVDLILNRDADMHSTDLFREALKHKLRGHSETTQKQLSKATKIDATQLNDFIHGRKNFSEKRLKVIAKEIGEDYFQMLDHGHQHLYGKSLLDHPDDLPIGMTVESVTEKLRVLSQKDLKLVHDLIDRLSKNDES